MISPNAISPVARIGVGKWILVDFCGLNVFTSLKSKDCANLAPAPVFGYFKGQFIVDTALHTVQLLIMRTLQSRSHSKKLFNRRYNSVLLINRRNGNKEIADL